MFPAKYFQYESLLANPLAYQTTLNMKVIGQNIPGALLPQPLILQQLDFQQAGPVSKVLLIAALYKQGESLHATETPDYFLEVHPTYSYDILIPIGPGQGVYVLQLRNRCPVADISYKFLW